MKLQSQIESLLRIFYGLAIGTGISYVAVKFIFYGDPPYYGNLAKFPFGLFICALTIALGDWIICHLTINRYFYTSRIRLILDLIFPILIFPLFPAVNDLSLFKNIFTIYAFLSCCYSWVVFFEQKRVCDLYLIITFGFWTVVLIMMLVLKLDTKIPLLIYGIVYLILMLYFMGGDLKKCSKTDLNIDAKSED